MNIICQSLYYQYILDKFYLFNSPKTFRVIDLITIIKDEVLITVGCPIFPSILIAKYLFTGSLKIDQLII